MATSLQSVLKNIPEVICRVPKKISLYVALILVSSERKNYASMARASNISYNKVRIKDDEVEELLAESSNFLISLVKNLSSSKNKGYIIIDFTMLLKRFSEKITAVTYDRDGGSRRVEKGFSAGFILWSDGKITIPFNIDFWLRKKDAEELYKKKTEIAKELILLAKKQGIPVKEVRLDGAFSSVDMLLFFIQQKVKLTMRTHSNRVVISKQGKYKLSEQPKLKMKGNEKYKTIRASYKGIKGLYFTAHKRKSTGGGTEVVYIVSTVKRTPKGHVEAYEGRWPVEKKIRTSKQSLGITHCQSTNIEKQRFHIFCVMVAYAILQLTQNDKRKKSVEEVLHAIRREKRYDIVLKYIDLERTLMS